MDNTCQGVILLHKVVPFSTRNLVPNSISVTNIDVNELAKRPGLGIELDMDLVRSSTQYLPWGIRRYITRDGSTPML